MRMTLARRSSLVVLMLTLLTLPLAGQEYRVEPWKFLEAKLAAEQGDFAEALRILDALIAKEPSSVVLRYERILVLLDDERDQRAEEELRRLTVLDPEFAEAHGLLGRLLLDRSRGNAKIVEEALDHLERAWQLQPSDLTTGLTVAQLLLTTGKMERAEKILASLTEQAPDQRAANYMYAQVLTKLGRGDESRVYLERVVTNDPTFAPAVFQLVELYKDASEFEKAAETLQPMIEAEPLNLDYQKQQAFYWLRAGKAEKSAEAFQRLVVADPNDGRSLYFLAESLNDLRRYAEAEPHYRRLLEISPRDPELLASFGLNQSAQRRFDEARRSFEQLRDFDGAPEPLVVLAKTQLAMIDYRTGRYDEALAGARQVLVFRDKPNLQAINVALEVLRRGERYADAIGLLEPLVRDYGSEPFLVAQWIEMLARSGDTARAREAGAPYLTREKRDALTVAEAWVNAERYDEGIAVARDLLVKYPDDVDILFELGAFYERADRPEDSEKTFLALLEKHPEHAPTLNYLGYMWAERGVHLARAEAMLVIAVRKEPENGAFIDSLGWVYYKLGKLDLAEKYLIDASKRLPGDPTVQAHLGDVLRQKGDVEGALHLYEMALTLNPDSEEEAQIRSKIGKIGRK